MELDICPAGVGFGAVSIHAGPSPSVFVLLAYVLSTVLGGDTSVLYVRVQSKGCWHWHFLVQVFILTGFWLFLSGLIVLWDRHGVWRTFR